MTQTTSANVIDPDVWADMMAAEFVGRVVLGQDGGNGFAVVDDTLEGQPGEKVSKGKWKKLGDDDELDDLTEGTPLVPDLLDSDQEDGPVIAEAGKAAEVTDRALLVGMGDPLAEVREQFGILTARKVDTKLRAAAEAATVAAGGLVYNHWQNTTAAIDNAGKFGAGAVANALSLFGDDADPDTIAGIIIHSRQRTDAFRSDHFISADKYGPGAVIIRGQIGDVYGVPVVVTDRTSKITDVDAGTAGNQAGFNALLMKKGALALYLKRRPVVETDRDILARSTVVTTNIHFAAGVLKQSGIVAVKTL